MRRLLLPLLLLGAGCAAEAPAPGAGPPESPPAAPAVLPAPLRRMVLNEGHPTALPVAFDHAFHARAGAGSPCASCHHELRARPGLVPSPCTACHLPFYLLREVDESAPHRHDGPPDL
ncbi:MAG: cytochrome c3 family protein [Planctomycetes bacterium]|nr:cytochrome c3 family protein [Planctomycetota bacterium]